TFIAAGGGAFSYIPCLNDSVEGIAFLRKLIRRELEGWIDRP
ncbi:MAG: ferrochelatase, partial [Sphingomonas sanxanigenens]